MGLLKAWCVFFLLVPGWTYLLWNWPGFSDSAALKTWYITCCIFLHLLWWKIDGTHGWQSCWLGLSCIQCQHGFENGVALQCFCRVLLLECHHILWWLTVLRNGIEASCSRANHVHEDIYYLEAKIDVNEKAVFKSRELSQTLSVKEDKPLIANTQCVVYPFFKVSCAMQTMLGSLPNTYINT